MMRTCNFLPAHAPRKQERWRCKSCGTTRRRVVPLTSEVFGALRSFWLYRVGGSVVWQSRRPQCTGLRGA